MCFMKFDTQRNKLFFSLENMYGIFRSKDSAGVYSSSSEDYDIDCIETHSCNNFNDALKMIMFSHKAGIIKLIPNSIICIKINGVFNSYRYMEPVCERENLADAFIKIKNFTKRESDRTKRNLHIENIVIGASGEDYFNIDDIRNKTLYGIDYDEISINRLSSSSNYNLYVMHPDDKRIRKICSRNGYVQIKNVKYLFDRELQDNPESLLLHSRKELEIVNDYCQLRYL